MPKETVPPLLRTPPVAARMSTETLATVIAYLHGPIDESHLPTNVVAARLHNTVCHLTLLSKSISIRSLG